MYYHWPQYLRFFCSIADEKGKGGTTVGVRRRWLARPAGCPTRCRWCGRIWVREAWRGKRWEVGGWLYDIILWQQRERGENTCVMYTRDKTYLIWLVVVRWDVWETSLHASTWHIRCKATQMLWLLQEVSPCDPPALYSPVVEGLRPMSSNCFWTSSLKTKVSSKFIYDRFFLWKPSWVYVCMPSESERKRRNIALGI
jgi:hypothetical protein